MAGKIYLFVNMVILVNFGIVGNVILGSDYGMCIDFYIMFDLYQVIEFYVFLDDGVVYCGLVDGGIGINFDFIFDDDIFNVYDFIVVLVFFWGKVKVIVVNYCVGMDNIILAYFVVVQDLGIGIDQCIWADFGVFVDIGLCYDDCIFFNLSFSFYDYSGVNVYLIVDYSFVVNYSCFRNVGCWFCLLFKLLQ